MTLKTYQLGGDNDDFQTALEGTHFFPVRVSPEAEGWKSILFTDFKRIVTADVNARIDEITGSGAAGPSIWPTPRTMTINGVVSGSVAFDGSANFSVLTSMADGTLSIAKTAGLQAALNAKLATDGTAAAATKLATARSIALAGAVTGSASFDGSSNITLNTTIADSSVSIAKVNGLQVILDGKADLDGADFTGLLTSRGPAFEVWAPAAASDAVIRYRNHQGLLRGSVVWDHASDSMQVRRYSADGSSTEGELAIYDDHLAFNGNDIYHAGNLPTASLGYLDMAVVTYASTAGQNVNTLTPGSKAMVHGNNPNVPVSGTDYWYIETIRIGSGVNNFIQRAINQTTQESYHRTNVSGVFSGWRRHWTSANFDPTAKLDINGTATAATKLATARALSLTGVVTASAINFDGTDNVALATAIADGALSIAKTAGLQAVLDSKVAADAVWQKGISGPNLDSFTGDLNDLNGFAAVYAQTAATNKPGLNANILNFGLVNYNTQFGLRDNTFKFRTQNAGTWQSWNTVWHEGNFNPAGYVPTTWSITGGQGLIGGGDASTARTITMGTPTSITGTSTNVVTTGSHTHELNMVYSPADQTVAATSYPQNVVSTGQITAGGPSAAAPHITTAFSAGIRVGQLVFDVNGGTGTPNIYYRTSHTTMNGGGWTSFIKVWSEANQFALGATQATARTALGIGSSASLDSDRMVTLSPGKLLDPSVNDFGVVDNSIGTGLYQYHGTNAVGGPAGASWGSVIHMRRAAGGGETQIYASEAGNMSIRGRTTGVWSSWNTVFHSNNASVAGPLISPYITGHTIVSENIGAGKDLNDYVVSGLYLQPNNSNISSGANYPSTLAGWLTVTANSAGTYVHQSYSNYSSGITYVRTKYNSTWYPWRQLWDSSTQFDIGGTQASARTALGLNSAAYQPDTNVPLLSRSMNSIGAAASDWRLAASSAAGSDVLSMRFASGGAYNPSRGAILELNGLNTAADSGAFRLLAAPGSTPRISAGEGSTLTVTAGTTGTLAFTGTSTFTGNITQNGAFTTSGAISGGSVTIGANAVGLFYQGSTSVAAVRVNDGVGGYRYFNFNGANGNIEALNGTFTVGSSKYPVWHSGNLSLGSIVTRESDQITRVDTRVSGGFWQANEPVAGFPTNGTGVGWYHLISSTHNNTGNYYALQFTAHFDDPNTLYYRNTGNVGTRGWNRIWHSGNVTPLNAATGGDIIGATNVYAGAFGAQTRTMNFGYNNGVPRWAQVLETDASLSWYAYDQNGAGAKRAINVATTLTGGSDTINIYGNVISRKFTVNGQSDAHVEVAPTGGRVIRFASTSTPQCGIYDTTNGYWLLTFGGTANAIFAGTATATDFVLSSDRRLKANIQTMKGKTRLRPVRYQMIETGKWETGFVAQEVRKIEPTAVTKKDDGFLGVAYDRLIPVISQQVNHVEDNVESMQKKYSALEKRTAALEKQLKKLLSMQ